MSQNKIKLPYNFTPRNYQLPVLKALDSGFKRACCVWHRRSGKDKVFINHMARQMFRRIGGYYYVFPTYKQGKKVIWNGMDRDGFKFTDHIPQSLRMRTDNSEMLIETIKPSSLMTNEEKERYEAGEVIKGSLFQVVGSDNIDSIVGANPVGIVFSEWALQDPAAWDYMRPILAENDGWAIFNYTPRGKNHGYTLYTYAKSNPEHWYCERLTVKDTNAIDPITLANERKEIIAKNGNDALYLQEYECDFSVPVEGAYYANQLREAEDAGRITHVPHDQNALVHTFWDLGYNDFTAIWFMQRIGREYHFIDYYESSNKPMDHYIKVLKDKPYLYGDHFAPHDIEVHEYSTGRTRLETARSLGVTFEVVERHKREDGINAVRGILSQCWFDVHHCDRGLSALRSYRHEWDERLQTYKPTPVHDWASHGADAFRTFAVGWKERIAESSALDFTETAENQLDPYDYV